MYQLCQCEDKHSKHLYHIGFGDISFADIPDEIIGYHSKSESTCCVIDWQCDLHMDSEDIVKDILGNGYTCGQKSCCKVELFILYFLYQIQEKIAIRHNKVHGEKLNLCLKSGVNKGREYAVVGHDPC